MIVFEKFLIDCNHFLMLRIIQTFIAYGSSDTKGANKTLETTPSSCATLRVTPQRSHIGLKKDILADTSGREFKRTNLIGC